MRGTLAAVTLTYACHLALAFTPNVFPKRRAFLCANSVHGDALEVKLSNTFQREFDTAKGNPESIEGLRWKVDRLIKERNRQNEDVLRKNISSVRT